MREASGMLCFDKFTLPGVPSQNLRVRPSSKILCHAVVLSDARVTRGSIAEPSQGLLSFLFKLTALSD